MEYIAVVTQMLDQLHLIESSRDEVLVIEKIE